MELAVINRLTDIEVAVADLHVVSARRVCARPGLEVNWGALATEVGKRDQVPVTAFQTFRELVHPPPRIQNYVSPSDRSAKSLASAMNESCFDLGKH